MHRQATNDGDATHTHTHTATLTLRCREHIRAQHFHQFTNIFIRMGGTFSMQWYTIVSSLLDFSFFYSQLWRFLCMYAGMMWWLRYCGKIKRNHSRSMCVSACAPVCMYRMCLAFGVAVIINTRMHAKNVWNWNCFIRDLRWLYTCGPDFSSKMDSLNSFDEWGKYMRALSSRLLKWLSTTFKWQLEIRLLEAN